MSKQDQAARIAANHYGEYVADYQEYRKRLARSIRRAITAAVRKERERCVGIVVDELVGKSFVGPESIVTAIRKGKA